MLETPAPGPADAAPTEDAQPDRYMPVAKAAIVEAIAADPRLPARAGAGIAALARQLGRLFHLEYYDRREALRDLYVALNPDQPGEGPIDAPEDAHARLMAELRAAATAANFTELTRAEIAEAETRMGRVRATVRVPWELYDEVTFFARGRRRQRIEWRSLFGLKRNEAELLAYDQVIMVCRVRRDPPKRLMRRTRLRPGGLYLKLFRDIPAADFDALFPNGRVVVSLTDKALIGVPAIVGGIPILLNIVPALSVLFVVVAAYLGIQGTVQDNDMKKAIAALSGLGALVGFIMRQWVKYERQALRYQQQVTDNAYLKNLNNNAGFFDFIIGASEDSEVKEAILAYAFLVIDGGAVAEAELDSRIEAWLEERFGVTVDFEIDDALAKLTRLGLAEEGPDGYVTVPLDAALGRVRAAWSALAEEG